MHLEKSALHHQYRYINNKDVEKSATKSNLNYYLSILKNEMIAIMIENEYKSIRVENILFVYLLTIQNMYFFTYIKS